MVVVKQRYHLSVVPKENRIGVQLRELREESFLSQAALSQKSGVGQVTIARIETGRQLPRFATVRKLAMALDVEPRIIAPRPALLRVPLPIERRRGQRSQTEHADAGLVGSVGEPPRANLRPLDSLRRVAEPKAEYKLPPQPETLPD